MRIFGNINGIDILYSDIFTKEDNECVKVSVVSYNPNGKKRSAVCILPELAWSEINNFDEITIKYLENIIVYYKELIAKEAREKKGKKI